MDILIERYDLLSLVEKALVTDAGLVGGKCLSGPIHIQASVRLTLIRIDVKDIYMPISDPPILGLFQHLLLASVPSVKKVLRRDFLSVLDTLRPLAEDADHLSAPIILEWWVDLAKKMGISEQGLRAQRAAQAKQKAGSDVVGCSWFKCVRFDIPCDPSVLYRCLGCRKLVYCGPMCQTRYVS